MINSITKQKNAVAVELFSAAWCNLDCKYCYIPKHNQTIIDKHQEIIDEVKKVDPLIKRIKKLYGNDVSIMSHWGSEPSLTIKYFKDFYHRAFKEFPSLKTISWSSNFLSRIDDMVDFISELSPHDDRELDFDIQLSLDGPPWITDENRRGGATKNIVENMYDFFEKINNLPEEKIKGKTIKTHFKPTMSKEQYVPMTNYDTVYNYYLFFDKVCWNLSERNKKGRIKPTFNCDPTVICPDDYTKQDGINFNKMYETIQEVRHNVTFRKIKPDFNYYFAFQKLCILSHELFTKSKMFTCSAGDSQFGISERLHPCHDTFYHPYEAMKDAYKKDNDRSHSNHESDNVQTGRMDITKDKLTKNIDSLSNKELFDYIYMMRGFHDFTKMRLTYCMAIIKEMAYCGQVSECYKNDDMAELLALFSITRHSCPTGHMQYLGSMNLIHPVYFKLFGNGLLENFVRRWLKGE